MRTKSCITPKKKAWLFQRFKMKTMVLTSDKEQVAIPRNS